MIPLPMMYRCFRSAALPFIGIILFLSGCSTFRDFGPSELTERLVTPGASVVRLNLQGEETAVTALLQKLLPEAFAEQILPDTDSFVLILYPEGEGGGFVLAAQGDYPSGSFSFGLTMDRNWKKQNQPLGYWENRGAGYQISVVSGNLMLISQNRLPDALSSLKNPGAAGGSGTGGSDAPVSMSLAQPGAFLPELAEQYPDLIEGIDEVRIEIFFDEEWVTFDGEIHFSNPETAEAAVRPFKFMILAEAKKSGMELMKKTMTETEIGDENGELHFSRLPMEAERFNEFALKLLSDFSSESSL